MDGMGAQGAAPCFSLFKPSWHSCCCTGFSGHAAPTFPLCPQPTGLMSSRELRPRPLCLPPCMHILSCCNLPLSLAAADRFDEFQGAMTATAVVTQLAAIESSLGLKGGTLHNPGARLAHPCGCSSVGLERERAAAALPRTRLPTRLPTHLPSAANDLLPCPTVLRPALLSSLATAASCNKRFHRSLCSAIAPHPCCVLLPFALPSPLLQPPPAARRSSL